MIIFITGGTSGIGKAIAEFLHAEGHRVFAAGRRAENKISEAAVSELNLDVTEELSVKKAVTEILNSAGRIDVLIQCAGQGAIGPLEEFTAKDVEAVFNLNLLGILRVNQEVIPHMRKQKSGRIIQISSLAAEAGLPFQGVYCASKAALDIMNESLRMELKPFGIQSCVLQPGDFKTDVAQHRKLTECKTDSPYKDQFERINNSATSKVELAANPVKVAQKVRKIIKKKKMKPRYRVGSAIEVIMPVLKALLPSTWFEQLLLKYYKL